MQYSPHVHDGFLKMLRGYTIDLSETRLILVTGDALHLEPTALCIQQNLRTQGLRTIGMEVWRGSDASINIRPFVFTAKTCTYNSSDYVQGATRAEALFVRLPGARTGVTASLALLEGLESSIRVRPTWRTSTRAATRAAVTRRRSSVCSTPTCGAPARSASASPQAAGIAATTTPTTPAERRTSASAPSGASRRAA
eukprot:7383040-Prymnesium_polylepis.1